MLRRLAASFRILPAVVAIFGLLAAGDAVSAGRARMRIVFVIDSTSHMAAVFGDASKLVAAEDALLSVLPVHADKLDIGFLVYGHRVSGEQSCQDIDHLSPVGPFDANSVKALFGGLKTKGDAPVAAALQSGLSDKQLGDGHTGVILIAGGPDGCHANPCEIAGTLAAAHAPPINVIAIDAGGEAQGFEALKCVADRTKGGFWQVGSTMELAAALDDAIAGILKKSDNGVPPTAGQEGQSSMATPPPGGSVQMAPQSGKANDAEITFSALLTDAGPQLTTGLNWSVFLPSNGAKDALKLLASSHDANPSFKLPAGDYIVNVAYGRAYLTRTVKLTAGQQTAQLVVNAGGLKVEAHLADGSVAPDQLVHCDLFSDQRDQSGNRAKVLSQIKPGVVVRLNSGLYHVEATYGDANATVGVDVGVEAGKVTDAAFTLTGARVSFKLVDQSGGEALTGTYWTILGAGGETIKQSLAALPTLILAAGNYTVVAERSGKKYTQDFAVQPSQPALVEVLANADQ